MLSLLVAKAKELLRAPALLVAQDWVMPGLPHVDEGSSLQVLVRQALSVAKSFGIPR